MSWAKLNDIDGAEAAYRAAIAADPGHVNAHLGLGTMLHTVRGDLGGAETAFRAAIAADPGYVITHASLGKVLAKRAVQIEQSDGDGDLSVAVWDQVLEHSHTSPR